MFVLYYTTEHVDPFVGIQTPRNRIVKIGSKEECEETKQKLYGRRVVIEMMNDNISRIVENIKINGNGFEWAFD
jgi:hypothetical protein